MRPFASSASDWCSETGCAVEPVVVAALLANRRVAWVTADQSLTITAVVDSTGLLGPVCVQPGAALLDVLPELVGAERDLEAVRRGQIASWQIDLIERADRAGQAVYVRLVVAAGGQELTCIFEDVTDLGLTHQRLTQSRNELLLAQRDLASAVRDLRASNAELRRLTDMKSVFVSVAAHELRTPLAVITSYADLLAQGLVGDLNDRQLQSIAIIRDGAERLLQITANLLDMTRIEAGRLELVLQVLDAGALVEQIVAEQRPLFDQAGQYLSLTIAPHLPLALIDELRTTQIIVNLLSNARKYTPAGGAIDVALAAFDDDGELLLTVSDTGVGIAPEDQPEIGTWLFRAQTANQISAKGVGLGLYITRSLVELHGGRFWFESAPGQGSAFHVSFLAAEPEPAEEQPCL